MVPGTQTIQAGKQLCRAPKAVETTRTRLIEVDLSCLDDNDEYRVDEVVSITDELDDLLDISAGKECSGRVFTITEIARWLGVDRSQFRRWVARQGFDTIRIRTQRSGNQVQIGATLEETRRIVQRRIDLGFMPNVPYRQGEKCSIVMQESGSDA